MQITTTPAAVRIGRRVFPFTSFEDVSRAYRRAIDAMNVGASRTPQCDILTADGKIVAYVSYNGRVWAGSRFDSHPDATPIYDSRLEKVA